MNIADTNRAGTAMPDQSDLITSTEMKVRLVCVGNREFGPMKAWIDRAFAGLEPFEYVNLAKSSNVILGADYEILLLLGLDARRIADIYRNFAPFLRNRIVVAVTRKSTPQTRALMLRAGLDDVMDADKINPVEGVARFRAMRRRWIGSQAIEQEQARVKSLYTSICALNWLNAREKRIVEALIERPGWCVPFERLQRVASGSDDPISIKNLRVSMSMLRRKLAEGVRIQAVPHNGYVLLRDEAESAE